MKRIYTIYPPASADVLHSTPIRSKVRNGGGGDGSGESSSERIIEIDKSPVKMASKPIDIPVPSNKHQQQQFGDGERRRNFDSSLTAFQVGTDEVLFHLGAQKYLIISRTDGPFRVTRIQICDLSANPSKRKTRARFTLQQWTDLTSLYDTINDVIQKEEEAEGSGIIEDDGVLRWPVGGNVYVTLRRGMPGLDFRWFWLPPEEEKVDYHQAPELFKVHPTKYGVWLNYAKWHKVIMLTSVVTHLIPDLANMKACNLQHMNSLNLHMCHHCNPNGFHAWEN
jgi:hypothetical protein